MRQVDGIGDAGHGLIVRRCQRIRRTPAAPDPIATTTSDPAAPTRPSREIYSELTGGPLFPILGGLSSRRSGTDLSPHTAPRERMLFAIT